MPSWRQEQGTLSAIPSGYAGVIVTLKMMAQCIKAGKQDQQFRVFVADLVSHLPAKDFSGEINACFDYVHDNIRYIQDPNNIETLSWPQQTLINGFGDCDDMVILLQAMLEVIGYQTRTIACGTQQAGIYEHVFCQVQFGDGKWLSMDPTEDNGIGWQPPNILSWKAWYP